LREVLDDSIKSREDFEHATHGCRFWPHPGGQLEGQRGGGLPRGQSGGGAGRIGQSVARAADPERNTAESHDRPHLSRPGSNVVRYAAFAMVLVLPAAR